jgi:hypothetical protein
VRIPENFWPVSCGIPRRYQALFSSCVPDSTAGGATKGIAVLVFFAFVPPYLLFFETQNY